MWSSRYPTVKYRLEEKLQQKEIKSILLCSFRNIRSSWNCQLYACFTCIVYDVVGSMILLSTVLPNTGRAGGRAIKRFDGEWIAAPRAVHSSAAGPARPGTKAPRGGSITPHTRHCLHTRAYVCTAGTRARIQDASRVSDGRYPRVVKLSRLRDTPCMRTRAAVAYVKELQL